MSKKERYYCNENLVVIDSKTKKSCSYFECMNLLNEKEDKLRRIEKEVYTCNIYHDNLKDIVLKIRCILDGDVE